MTDREVMKMALDALKYHTEHTYPFHLTNVAIEALQKVLAQPDPIQVRPAEFAATVSAGVGADFVGTPMIWAEWPTRPEQVSLRDEAKRFALMQGGGGAGGRGWFDGLGSGAKYSDIVSDGGFDPRNKFDAQPEPVNGYTKSQANGYTAPPPKRPWVGLTIEEMHNLNDVLNLNGRFSIIEAIEAKLKEKNGAT